MAAPLSVDQSNIRVSSVLNRDTKQFGKKYLVDGDDDTCWNSDQGSPQCISISFERCIRLEEVHIQFQGGFAGRDCWIEGKCTVDDDYTKLQEFYPEDVNSLQVFKFEATNPLCSMKIVFNNSTDFFGRITIYKIELIGTER